MNTICNFVACYESARSVLISVSEEEGGSDRSRQQQQPKMRHSVTADVTCLFQLWNGLLNSTCNNLLHHLSYILNHKLPQLNILYFKHTCSSLLLLDSIRFRLGLILQIGSKIQVGSRIYGILDLLSFSYFFDVILSHCPLNHQRYKDS